MGNRADSISSVLPADRFLRADPGFVSATDLHLTAGSPAIDIGGSTGAPERDFDGTRRPIGAGIDIGAFEFDPLRDAGTREDAAAVSLDAAATVDAPATLTDAPARTNRRGQRRVGGLAPDDGRRLARR